MNDVTTKIEIEEYPIMCKNCENAIPTFTRSRKYFGCKHGTGVFPASAKFKECKHYKLDELKPLKSGLYYNNTKAKNLVEKSRLQLLEEYHE